MAFVSGNERHDGSAKALRADLIGGVETRVTALPDNSVEVKYSIGSSATSFFAPSWVSVSIAAEALEVISGDSSSKIYYPSDLIEVFTRIRAGS